MYYFLCAIIIIANIFFALRHLFTAKSRDTQKKEKLSKIFKLIISAYSLSGIIASSLSCLLLRLRLNGADLEAEYSLWAKDMFFGFVKIASLIFVVLSLVSVLSALLSKKATVLRSLLSLMASVIFIIYGFLYSYVASNDTVSLTPYILIFSLGLACAISFPLLFDGQNIKLKRTV